MSISFYSRHIGYNKNMDILLKNKKTVVAAVAALMAFYFYSVFFGPEPSVGETESVATSENLKLIETANELSGITFNQNLFKNPAYRYLVDFSTVLTPQPTGRANPFDVIGRD